MSTKTVGVLFGMEDTFPWALINEINARGGGEIKAEPVSVGAIRDDRSEGYAAIVDRISHDVPFYRTWLKCEAARGVLVVNNPFWWSADDKFFDNVVAEAAGVAVPRTVLLPHKQHPPNTETKSFRNMKFVEWDETFEYLGFPIFMKPADGGGWRDVYKCDNREEFFAAYDQTRNLTMMAQEAIDFESYYRCWVVGRDRVRVMEYDPRAPFHERYVRTDPSLDDPLVRRVHEGAIRLCRLLGYDMNTVEFAVRDGIPYAIDFMNCAPDADVNSVGQENFDWIVSNMADFLVTRLRSGGRFELTGDWPSTMKLGAAPRPAAQPSPATGNRQAPASKPSGKVASQSNRPGTSKRVSAPAVSTPDSAGPKQSRTRKKREE